MNYANVLQETLQRIFKDNIEVVSTGTTSFETLGYTFTQVEGEVKSPSIKGTTIRKAMGWQVDVYVPHYDPDVGEDGDNQELGWCESFASAAHLMVSHYAGFRAFHLIEEAVSNG